MNRFCDRCGHAVKPGAAFCSLCGAALLPTAMNAPPVQAGPPPQILPTDLYVKRCGGLSMLFVAVFIVFITGLIPFLMMRSAVHTAVHTHHVMRDDALRSEERAVERARESRNSYLRRSNRPGSNP